MAAACLLSCSTQQTAQRTADKSRAAALLARQVADSIDARTFSVAFSFVTPQRFQPRPLTSDYDIRVSGDSITSCLPYFGRAYRTDMTRNHRSPLDFQGRVTAWQATTRRNRTELTIVTRDNLEELQYHLTVYPNARVSLHVTSTDREAISFDGEMRVAPAPLTNEP